PRGRLPDTVDDALQGRGPVPLLAALHEGYLAPEVIDHALEASRVPPLGGEVPLAAGHPDPEPLRHALLGPPGAPRLLLRGQMDVALESCQPDAQAQAPFEELGVAVEEVEGELVALVDERVVHVDDLDARLALAQRCQVRVVLPQRRAGGADVGLELPR